MKSTDSQLGKKLKIYTIYITQQQQQKTSS
jgi:hypothetical protein